MSDRCNGSFRVASMHYSGFQESDVCVCGGKGQLVSECPLESPPVEGGDQ
jgi:hypothetical protein